MKQIVWQNNIKELLYTKTDPEEFQKLIEQITDLYVTQFKISGKVWCDLKYLNTVLMLFFTYFKKFNNPSQVFFSLVFKNISNDTSEDKRLNLDLFKAFANVNTDFYICSNNTKCGVYYLLTQDEFLTNDVGVSENDFELFKDILLYANVVKVRPNIWSGLLFDSEHGLSFKYKGPVTPEILKEMILPALDIMRENLTKFNSDFIRKAYHERIMHILETYPTLKVKGR